MSVKNNMPSIEVQKRMHAFFMRTSAPRIYEQLTEEERRKYDTDNHTAIRQTVGEHISRH
ncbi:hypothetical protein [Sporosarcina cascadiensis]|uniref:hypothetical protein n=1 Tax=Sporosarcina cascadiensis TaxID=2660747 RepID=UPI00129BB522|nr:hypothetical protein [Sporosarcina cascadiensis]